MVEASPEIQRLLAFIAAAASAGAAYLHQLWKYNRDAYQARVDETCKLIFELADAGAQFWATARGKWTSVSAKKPDKSATPAEREEKLGISAVQIGGRLSELQFYRLLVAQRFSRADSDKLTELMGNFQDVMTGGDFSAKVRAADHVTAAEVYNRACDLVAHLRSGAQRGNRFFNIVVRCIEPYLPYQRPTEPAKKIEEMVYLVGFALCVSLALGCFLIWISYWLADLFLR